MKKTKFAKFGTVILLLCGSPLISVAGETAGLDYERARWHPIHFKPAIDSATNEQCLECHQAILDRKVKEQSPAGVKAANALAWYQTLDVYEGEQETFHRRHLVTPLAKQVMNLQCNFCHQGHDPREEAPIPPTTKASFTLRKMVDPETTCLKCHGKYDYKVMGLPGPWTENGKLFNNNCLICHQGIRTNRHQVTYLNAEAIEKAGQENSDSCYGCHGGRQWYRISYPYPRHPWPGYAPVVPDWAKDRPTESEARFRK
jgi:nitrate/TMAO reductase-like tetraheme cytochrome c subunit